MAEIIEAGFAGKCFVVPTVTVGGIKVENFDPRIAPEEEEYDPLTSNGGWISGDPNIPKADVVPIEKRYDKCEDGSYRTKDGEVWPYGITEEFKKRGYIIHHIL